jgi:ParB family chromosome partitioning protein
MNNKRDPWAAVKPKLDAAVEGLHRKDEALRETKDRDREGGESSSMALELIKPRPHGDSRPLDQGHVRALAESIVAIGLLQPVVVDRKARLVCGGHRLAAVQYLKINAPESYARRFPNDQMPVRIIIELDAEADRTAARAAELEENEKRKGFTKGQVIALAQSLKAEGCRFTVGRPKPGESALAPTLAVVTGLGLRTVRRYLAESGATAKPTVVRKKQSLKISEEVREILNRGQDMCAYLRLMKETKLFDKTNSLAMTRVIAAIERVTKAMDA